MQSHEKIYRLGHKETQELFAGGYVEVTEKLDGSQIGFGIFHHQLEIRSKSVPINYTVMDSVPKMFRPAVEHILSIQDRLEPGFRYYGETLATKRHNKLCYDRVPKSHIALFSVINNNGDYLTCDFRKLVADKLECDVVPLLYNGHTFDKIMINALMASTSGLGGKIEGIVARNYTTNTIAKLVTDEFAEKIQKQRTTKTYEERINELFSQYYTQARWDKAYQHLSEAGLLKNDFSDLGALIKEVNIDTMNEEEEELREAVWQIYRKKFLKELTYGINKWYDQKLQNQQE